MTSSRLHPLRRFLPHEKRLVAHRATALRCQPGWGTIRKDMTSPGSAERPVAVRDAIPRWWLWLSLGLAWAAAACTALLFVVAGSVLDDGLQASSLTALIGLAVAGAACLGVGAWFSAWASADAERRLRSLVLGRMFTTATPSVETRSGWLLSLSTEAVERTSHYVAGFLGPIIGALSTPLLVLAVMALTVDPAVAATLAICVLLVPLAIGGFQRVVRPIGAAYRREQSSLTAAFLEAIQALDTLVYARAAGRKADDLARDGERHRRSLMRLLAGNQILIFVVDAAFSLSIIVVAAIVAVQRVEAGTLTFGQAVAIVLMCTLVVGPVDVVGQFFYIGIGGRAARRQLTEFLQETGHRPDPASTSGAPEAGGPGEIVCEDVTAAWPDGPDVVRNLDLRVATGERVALVGPSGVGKSTVAALLSAVLLPTRGTVTVDGLDTAITDPARVRSRLGVVEQRTFLFDGTIADNLRVADATASDADLWRALSVAGLDAEVRAMSAGLNTPVGERGGLLSGGQAQRLAIARVVLRDAPILVLDEPTSQVDLAGERAILAALERAASGRTVLMIAHRPGALLTADRVVRLTAPTTTSSAS